LFPHFLVFRRLLDLLDVFQSADALADRGEIGQRAAQPPLVHVELPARQSGFFYCFLRLFFAADKQNPATAAGDLLEEIGCTPELPHRFIKIDNVNLIALFKDERLHLWIPTLRLVSKMNTSFQ
jgi:hypothetical protein